MTTTTLPPRVYCLSVRQPWAWLLVQGLKDVENRSWPTRHRGDLLIHASKALTGKRGTQLILDRLEPHFAKQIVGDWPRAGDLDVSAIVGAVELVDVVVDNSGASMVDLKPVAPTEDPENFDLVEHQARMREHEATMQDYADRKRAREEELALRSKYYESVDDGTMKAMLEEVRMMRVAVESLARRN